MVNFNLKYKKQKPHNLLSLYVESFICIENPSEIDQQFYLFPDGQIDLFLKFKNQKLTSINSFPLEKHAIEIIFERDTLYFIICFTPLGLEYLNQSFNNLNLEFNNIEFNDFVEFSNKMTDYLLLFIPVDIDTRKKDLFQLIYSNKGEMKVKQIAEKIGWSSRQINRYFSKKFGLSLKTYSNIIRFRASFKQIRKGELYPENNFSDQAHFIKEVKKYSSFIPKELSKNENDRFIQFSIFPDE